jgi:RNA polymerase sigma factor (TIGR02999 family)
MRGLISYQRKLKQWVSSLTYPAGEPMIAALPFRSAMSPESSASPSGTNVTAMLRAWSEGEEQPSDDLVRAVYDQLRRQARRQLRRERREHTLDTAALVNEAYLKLIDQRPVNWQDRGHFFALAAELMRRILVDHARSKQRIKRGGPNATIAIEDVLASPQIGSQPRSIDLMALDEALDRLARMDKQQVKVVELRYFAGLDLEETAQALDVSVATVKRDWASAKAWLKHELTR